jgi:hypothetical protein
VWLLTSRVANAAAVSSVIAVTSALLSLLMATFKVMSIS